MMVGYIVCRTQKQCVTDSMKENRVKEKAVLLINKIMTIPLQ